MNNIRTRTRASGIFSIGGLDDHRVELATDAVQGRDRARRMEQTADVYCESSAGQAFAVWLPM